MIKVRGLIIEGRCNSEGRTRIKLTNKHIRVAIIVSFIHPIRSNRTLQHLVAVLKSNEAPYTGIRADADTSRRA